MEEIQRNLFSLIGISDLSYSDDVNTYMTLTFRLYLLMFMLHYKMPIQRKNWPGNRNLSNLVYSFKKRGWYAYLSSKEQKMLNNPGIFVSQNTIPYDLIEGVLRNEITDFHNTKLEDIQNWQMFRETDVDSALSQQTIHMSKCKHSKYGQHQLSEKGLFVMTQKPI